MYSGRIKKNTSGFGTWRISLKTLSAPLSMLVFKNCHFTASHPLRVIILTKWKIASVGQDVEKFELLCFVGENVGATVRQFLYKLSNRIII